MKKPKTPVCAFCKRHGPGVTFAVFSPRFAPFGTACTDCERDLPPGTAHPLPIKECSHCRGKAASVRTYQELAGDDLLCPACARGIRREP